MRGVSNNHHCALHLASCQVYTCQAHLDDQAEEQMRTNAPLSQFLYKR